MPQRSTALRHTIIPALLLAAASLSLTAQTPAPPITATPVYDVVSIRENKTGTGGMSWRYGSDAFTADNITLMNLLMNAYGLRIDQVVGAPPWASSVHFNLQAKVVEPDPEVMKHLTRRQRREMLQTILTQRFGLKAHIEAKDMPIYELVVVRGGAKIQPVPVKPGDSEPKGAFSFGPGLFDMKNGSVSQLVDTLASTLERDVVDKTGLTGVYNIRIKWATDPDTPNADGAPTLFTALQEELGLRLQSSRGPVQTLVIDHIDLPTSNDD